jgi:ParB family chromosome partitioning protein
VSTGTKAKKTPRTSAYAGLGDILAGGFDAGLTDDASDQTVNLDDIEIVAQVREEFEDDDNSLAELGRSLRKIQLQAILLRPNPAGSAKPYQLVAGERRVRAARLEGLRSLRARVKALSDEEAADAQFAENVQRKNLTQIEEAKRIQRDLDQLGTVDKVLAKHNKSRAWLSKILSLLSLPEQAKRLVKENISADIELINSVRTIEKADPDKARALVDELKASRGKVNAREKVAAAKDEVKPPKTHKVPAKAGSKAEAGESVATARDRSQQDPSGGKVFAGAKKPTPADLLGQAFVNIFEFGSSPKTLVDTTLSVKDREAVEAWLKASHAAGAASKDVGRSVMVGIREGKFAPDGSAAFALIAFLHGAQGKKFSLLDILASAKP